MKNNTEYPYFTQAIVLYYYLHFTCIQSIPNKAHNNPNQYLCTLCMMSAAHELKKKKKKCNSVVYNLNILS